VRKRCSTMTLIVALGSFVCAGCGSSRQALLSVTVTPPTATATHGSANDTVRFATAGNYAIYDRGYYGPNASAVCLEHISDISRPLAQVT
jgi:hypothetical protein